MEWKRVSLSLFMQLQFVDITASMVGRDYRLSDGKPGCVFPAEKFIFTKTTTNTRKGGAMKIEWRAITLFNHIP